MSGTVFCGACGTHLSADAKFCASCGERQETLPAAGGQLAQTPDATSGVAGPVDIGRGHADASGTGPGQVIAAASALALFCFMFLPWFGGLYAGGASAWPAFSFIDVLLFLIVLVVVGVVALQALGIKPEPPWHTVVAVLGCAAVLLILFQFLFQLSLHSEIGSFLGLLAAVGIACASLPTLRYEGDIAKEIDISTASSARIRSFWVGFALSVLTLGVYGLFWYYFVNDELKDVGSAKGDDNLAQSSPMTSVIAIFIGGWLIVPPFLSIYNYGLRIKRAQRLGGVPVRDQINPMVAFLLYFPGLFLVIPYFAHFWYVTKHQNAALLANAQPTLDTAPRTTGAVA